MALQKCIECGNDVSDKASACPKCGAPVVQQSGGTSSAAAGELPVASAAPPPASIGQAPAHATAVQAKPSRPFFSTGRILAWVFILGGGWLAYKTMTGSSVAGAIRGPQVIVNERRQLKEGEAVGFGFVLPTARRVEVEVNAQPKNVNVMLMTEDQWGRYQKVKGSLWGGNYQYMPSLSRQGILVWSGSDVLPDGGWRVVVERPSESILFGDATNATVKITAY